MNPKVSIIVPVYKVENYIRRCLDSIENQIYTDWECLLVDDGTPDKAGEICDEYAHRDDRFRVFHQENQGVSAARNKGLDEARGTWIFFVDADDMVEKDSLANLLNVDECDLVVGGYEKIEDNFSYSLKNEKVEVSKELIELWNVDTFSGWPFWYVWGKLFKCSVIRENFLKFDDGLKYNEDNCFLINYICCIDVFCCVSKNVYLYFSPNLIRSEKFQMNFEEYKYHIETQKKCFQRLEMKTQFQFEKVRNNVFKRFFKSFVYYILSERNYDVFSDQLKSFKKYRGYDQSDLPIKWNLLSLFFRYTPCVVVYIMRNKIKSLSFKY